MTIVDCSSFSLGQSIGKCSFLFAVIYRKLYVLVSATEYKLTGPHSVLMLVSFRIQVTKLEEQGTATGKKRQLSRQELEEELENVKRVNRNFYKFAVEELMKEVHQATEKDAT